MYENDIVVDYAGASYGAGRDDAEWPKLVTAFLPDGGTSQAYFHADGSVEVLVDSFDRAPRLAG
ncbi:hypothetical protein [Dietzia sp.]|uniref:hypothetical protein n=1 Tax=Dietzia sp. TaxID=1871616 RepID=UPI002FD9831D